MASKNKGTKGYIVLWKTTDVRARYADLHAIAQQTGLDEKFVPNEPAKRDAWESGTQLGARGMQIDPPQNLVSQVKHDHGNDVTPRVRLVTKIISRKSPKLVRHIVREVTIATEQGRTTRRKALNQYDDQTVAILEYNVNDDVMRSTSQAELYDEAGWVNGSLVNVIREIESRVQDELEIAKSKDVREGLRAAMRDVFATLQSSGGAYFVPFSPDAFEKLRSIKVYLEALNDYTTGRGWKDRCSMMIVPLTSDREAYEASVDVAENAVHQFGDELGELVKELRPVIQGKRTQQVADNTRDRINARYVELLRGIKLYRDALGDKLNALDVRIDEVSAALSQAMTAECKPTKASENPQQDDTTKDDENDEA